MPADTITVYDTVVQGRTILIEDDAPRLLQERYFPTVEPLDLTDARGKIMLDFDNGDFKEGVYIRKGFSDVDTVSFFSKAVDVPRVAVEDGLLTSDKDRKIFEALCREQGVLNPNHADAMTDLLRIKSSRVVRRCSRSIEKLGATVLLNNAISFTCDTSPTDTTQVPISVQYYDSTNEQIFNPTVNWGSSGATPYADVCEMVKTLKNHGGKADDLLLNERAWDLLFADMKANGLIDSQIHYTTIANGDTRDLFNPAIEDAEWIGRALFNGHGLNIIVYNGAYENSSGVMTPYLGEDTFACVLAPMMGHTICGGAVLPNPAAMVSGNLSSALDIKVGKYIVSQYYDFKDNEVKVRCESNPLPAPLSKWKFITYRDND